MPTSIPPSSANAILVEACDIPVDMTIGEWRRQRPRRLAAAPPSVLLALRAPLHYGGDH